VSATILKRDKYKVFNLIALVTETLFYFLGRICWLVVAVG
jgi:hypothetical protein